MAFGDAGDPDDWDKQVHTVSMGFLNVQIELDCDAHA